MDIGYTILIVLIFTILILMIYDICSTNKILIHHLVIVILLVVASCTISMNTTRHKTPKPNTHPAINNVNNTNIDIDVDTSVKPVMDKIGNSTAAPIVPNAYDVCVGLLDGKTPGELAKIADGMRSTSSDKILERDASSLNPHWRDNPTEERHLIAMEIYPFMSGNQINTHDCLNDQGNGKSCFQSPSLMTDDIMNGQHTIGDNLATNSKRAHYSNQATAVLNLREGFQSTGDREIPGVVDFINAPEIQDLAGRQAPQEARESKALMDQLSRLVVGDLCTHCKIGNCFNGYCGADNYYFF